MPVSKAQQRATNKYQRNNYDEIKIRVRKGVREKMKQEIYDLGFDSVSKFIVDATFEKIEREKNK